MKFKSADLVFVSIALGQEFVNKDEAEQLKVELQRRRACGDTVGMQELFKELDLVNESQQLYLEKTLFKHARRCLDCARYTYLMTGERSRNISCEHCQGKLLPGRVDPEAQAARDRHHSSITTEYAHTKMLEYLEKSGAYDIRSFRAVKPKKPDPQ
jgi:hypothetical protein